MVEGRSRAGRSTRTFAARLLATPSCLLCQPVNYTAKSVRRSPLASLRTQDCALKITLDGILEVSATIL
jgi:hypothetical protein